MSPGRVEMLHLKVHKVRFLMMSIGRVISRTLPNEGCRDGYGFTKCHVEESAPSSSLSEHVVTTVRFRANYILVFLFSLILFCQIAAVNDISIDEAIVKLNETIKSGQFEVSVQTGNGGQVSFGLRFIFFR